MNKRIQSSIIILKKHNLSNNIKYIFISFLTVFVVFLFSKNHETIITHYQPQPFNLVNSIDNSVTRIIMKYGKQPINVAQKHTQLIFENAKKHNVDPFLILSIMFVESTFKEQARSNANAIGLMQVIYRWHKEKVESAEHLYNPEINVQVGTQIIKEYIERSKTEKEALLRYNGSLGKSDKYAKRVQKYRAIFKNEVIKEVKDEFNFKN